ncbi:MAG: hypothetical protein QOG85_529, partial [Gaiellaceae bacterium]|nr:hypothetical protein [Gaiellaceae bacterium]
SDTTHFHYTYYTCTEQTYTQTMTVTDHLGLQSTSQSQAHIRAGQFC